MSRLYGFSWKWLFATQSPPHPSLPLSRLPALLGLAEPTGVSGGDQGAAGLAPGCPEPGPGLPQAPLHPSASPPVKGAPRQGCPHRAGGGRGPGEQGTCLGFPGQRAASRGPGFSQHAGLTLSSARVSTPSLPGPSPSGHELLFKKHSDYFSGKARSWKAPGGRPHISDSDLQFIACLEQVSGPRAEVR